MALKCIIVDDEPPARQILEEYVDKVMELESLGSFKSALEAQSFLENHQIDLLFLDINMPGLSGMDWIRSLSLDILVIFTTAYSEYGAEAFDVRAFDFLVKPISLSRFMTAIGRVKEHLKLKNQLGTELPHVVIKEGKRAYMVPAAEIFYLQAFGDYVRIFTSTKTYIMKERLHKFLQLLPRSFVQVHRSYIINLDHVQYLEGNHLLVASNKVPVSHKYRQSVMEYLQE